MTTITIPKIEYLALKKQAQAYQKFAGRIFEDVFADPVPAIVDDFKKTALYSAGFIKDLEVGLKNLVKSKEWKSK